jgi:hypothetical protein
MAYLSKAIGEVLRDVRRTRNTAVAQARRQDDQHSREADEALQRESSALEFSAKKSAFQAEFPTAELQDRTVAEICRHMPFLPTPHIQRIYAIHKWFDLKSAANPSASTESGETQEDSPVKNSFAIENRNNERGAK